ncbi:indolepyruvate oxidoreductase subunit beta [Christensenella tenuis]|uniref:Indolepyruvate oxidoreductase subunit beta n=1 Tax=Christensenella tenuis TaxID=2763033 RepID=A0ABR7EID3_9FIRM|nr:indolepyruvate oxidoreductase subunit beta [Christensenella tenuis]MBC5649526.1 indolepyruvate oxidoreductase subunit beta [Christensenella tenuis]
MKCDILIAGVGGQGTILASKLIAQAAMEEGAFVRTSETIGMAQRGGCVVSHVRIGAQDESSVIPLRSADLLLGFEPAEAARSMARLKEGGTAVVNTARVVPVTASLSGKAYETEEIFDYLKNSAQVWMIDATGIAEQCGSAKAANVVMLGAGIGTGALQCSLEGMEKLLAQRLPEKLFSINQKALHAGYGCVRGEKGEAE